MNDVEFVDGLRVYAPREGAPSFIKASLVIERDVLRSWLDGRGQLVRLDIKEAKNGKLYAAVNNWKPRETVKDCPQSETPYKPAVKSGTSHSEHDDFSDDVPF